MWYPPATEAKQFPTAALSTSGIRVEGDSFLSACQNKLPCIFSCKIKTGGNPYGMPPVKNRCKMTSYGGIIRIRLKGRSWMTSSQPANTSSPVFISALSYTRFFQKASPFLKNNKKKWVGRVVYSASSCSISVSSASNSASASFTGWGVDISTPAIFSSSTGVSLQPEDRNFR